MCGFELELCEMAMSGVLFTTFLMMFVLSVAARSNPLFSILDSGKSVAGNGGGDVDHPLLSVLGDESAEPVPVRATFDVQYHSGPMLTGSENLNVFIVWYGRFSNGQRSTILDFFESFQDTDSVAPSVRSWWKTTAAYKDFANAGVPAGVKVAGEMSMNDYPLGVKLSRQDIEVLVLESVNSFTANSKAIYLVLTSEDVLVDGFCMSTCASHSFIHELPYAWVGNAATQCPGQCAWPFALPQYGPIGATPLVAPNGDIGADGMVINIANMLAGAATDPYISAWFQGDAGAPLEAATACAGIYGEGAYPGYAGKLLTESVSGASFNVRGHNGRKFLLPALWDPVTRTCAPPS